MKPIILVASARQEPKVIVEFNGLTALRPFEMGI